MELKIDAAAAGLGLDKGSGGPNWAVTWFSQ